ncbi:MAG: RidA family protein [Candidatus Zixiibacteriota bacterium]|nr:MAG: RidA family protein [candidate division Zixibacteria bacterium]
MKKQLISSGSPYEKSIGFSRALKVGGTIHVSGTAPISPDGSAACPGDAYGQAKRCLEIIRAALEEGGGSLEQVVRTRIYVTDRAVWEEVARAHGEVFSDIRPTSTLVIVKGFVDPDWLVEIEAECLTG